MSTQSADPADTTASPVSSGASMGRVARGSTANLIGALVTAVCNFGLAIAVTRGLSKPAAGVFFSTTSIFLLATVIGQLGSGTGLVYFFSRCRALGTPGLISGYLRAAVRPVLLTAVIMAVAVFVFAPQLASVTSPDYSDTAVVYLRVFALFIPLAGLENVALAATRGLGSMRPNALVAQVVRPVLQVALVVASLWISAVAALPIAWVLVYALTAFLAWAWWRRMHARLDGAESASGPIPVAEFWRFSAPRAFTSVIQMAMQRLDIVLVGALTGVAQAAVYAAATRFVVAGQMGSNAVSLATQPLLAEALARDERDHTNTIYRTSTAWLICITWPLYLVLIAFGGSLLKIFGDGYDAGVGSLLILSLAMLVSTGCGMVDMVLSMAGRTSWNLVNAVLALVVNLALDLWLIPLHGVVGAAIGWAVAIVVKNLAALVQVAWMLGLHPFGRSTTVAAALSLASFGAVPWLCVIVLGPGVESLAAGCVVGTVCMALGSWATRRVLQLDALLALRPSGRGARHQP